MVQLSYSLKGYTESCHVTQQFQPPSVPQRNENLHPHKNLYVNIRIKLIPKSQKVEPIQMPTN